MVAKLPSSMAQAFRYLRGGWEYVAWAREISKHLKVIPPYSLMGATRDVMWVNQLPAFVRPWPQRTFSIRTG